MKIQQILYNLIKNNISEFPIYVCQTDNLKRPYILIKNIEINTLPYSQELYKYESVDTTIVVYDDKHSNKTCLERMDKISHLIRMLPTTYQNINNLTIKSFIDNKKDYFVGEINLSFTNITNQTLN